MVFLPLFVFCCLPAQPYEWSGLSAERKKRAIPQVGVNAILSANDHHRRDGLELCLSDRLEKPNSVDLYKRNDNVEEDVLHKDTTPLQDKRIPHDHKQTQQNNLGSTNSQSDGNLFRRSNETTATYSNQTHHSTAAAAKPTTPPPTQKPILPVQTGVKAQEEEQSSGLTIFFSLLVANQRSAATGICIILVHLLIKFKLHFLPESVAVVSLEVFEPPFGSHPRSVRKGETFLKRQRPVSWHHMQTTIWINAAKTKELVVDFHRRRPTTLTPVNIQRKNIEMVNSKDLMNWTGHSTLMRFNGQSRLYLMRRLRSFWVQGGLLKTLLDFVVATSIFYVIVVEAAAYLQLGEVKQFNQMGILMGGFIKIIEFQELANWKVNCGPRGVAESLAEVIRAPKAPRPMLPHPQCLVQIYLLLPDQPRSAHYVRRHEEEMFRPNMFFLLLLPPIIFESGYSLHKGNFFQNIGSITLFAVIGTAISAFIVGGGIYFLGQADVIYKMTMTDSFAFGSLISAVDPVATIAIFNALNVDPVLNMLVFGESILNDAVSIVLTNTAEGFFSRSDNSMVTGWETFVQALGYFLKMFFGSAALGTLTGLISAVFLKHFDLRKTPSLEFGMMIIFAYLPYGLAEGIKLSVFAELLLPPTGIMSILFAGIVMSHYTHHNLSPITQILMQQTLRTVAFMCETCVFAFLGLSIFSFPHNFEISFVIWCIVLILLGRAINIFPLSFLLNFFRDHKITPKMMSIMWFSGLRGAIPYALSLHLGLEPIEKRQLIGTTTIIIVLFTILFLGGGTMPLIRIMDIEDSQSRRKNKKDVNLSKTQKMGNTIDTEHLSELTEEEYEAQIYQRQDLKGFMWLDAKYLNPFFTRRLTQEDLLHGRIQMKTLTNKWYEEVRQGPSGSEDDLLGKCSRGQDGALYESPGLDVWIRTMN
ncbi:hypothetical protein CCH79_00006723, partial [Gambusia affinis]